MKKVLVNEQTLANIAEAIRVKNGEIDSYYPSQMADKILAIEVGGGGDSGLPSEITTNLNYFNYSGHNDWIFELEKPITFIQRAAEGITSFFTNSSVVDASNLIFIVKGYLGTQVFSGCNYIEQLPNIYISTKTSNTSLNQWFNQCRRLRDIPTDYFQLKSASGEPLGETWITNLNGNNSAFIFRDCWSLRNIPDLTGIYYASNNGNYSKMFQNCHCLDEITTFIMPISTSATTTSNKFTNTFDKCHRLKRLVFPTQADGSPYVCSWSNQTIDLSQYVGYASSADNVIGYNSGCTADDEVTTRTEWKTAQSNPNWWTMEANFSRYDHASAVETINSLPDCSSGSGNTIKFLSTSGTETDNGSCYSLTEEEIAVATAKGWTVSFA